MNDQVIQQFKREAESWKRLLEFLQAENTYLKTRIAEIAGHDMDSELLTETENFQHHFLQEDELIALTRKEVTAFQDLISKEYKGSETGKEIVPAQKKLREHIEKLEQEFNKLKFEFNHYLIEKL